MSTEEIVLVATLHARPETRDDLYGRLLEMVELTVVEPGCLKYELHTDDADPMQFTFIETWASAAALARHDESSHVRAIISDVPKLTSRPVIIQRLRRVGQNKDL
ncbi:MAG TPA: putative quinol monooxygenase [Ilumatobacteraceae bacterium]